jgi:hypothetical protein
VKTIDRFIGSIACYLDVRSEARDLAPYGIPIIPNRNAPRGAGAFLRPLSFILESELESHYPLHSIHSIAENGVDKFAAMQLFVRVLEKGSFSAVAKERGIGQPREQAHFRA